jgi:hypothetical protein
LRAIYRYHDLLVGNGEREFNLSLVLVSVSVAFLAVVVPLLQNYSSPLFLAVLGCFSFSSVTGIVDLLWTIYRDRHYLELDQKWEDDNYRKFQAAAVAIYAKLIKGNPVFRREVDGYLALKNKMSSEQDERTTSRKNAFWTKALVWLHRIFLAVFFLGFILLISVTTTKLVNLPKQNAPASSHNI